MNRSEFLRAAAGALALLAALPACRALDLSFKTVVFEGVERERAFDVCREVIASHYWGTNIRADRASGRIETDPIEESIGGRTLREQCYVHVSALHGGQLEIALFARMQRLEVDAGAQNPVLWVDAGSDVQVEGLLLDEIAGRLLALDTDAKVVASTLPRAARPR
jgi:hypothetical protein